MVELRKRKAPIESTPPPVKKANSVRSTSSSKQAESSVGASIPSQKIISGSSIELDGFGGEVQTEEGSKVTLKMLVNDSKNGIVIFTYPKASTPGCTTQACMFRDEFTALTATGFSIYGLSTDSPKSNSNFKSKQNLPYALLCDPASTLIKAIGMKKTPSGTNRGVFVVDKGGKIEALSPGGPAATVEVVRELVRAKSVAKGNPAETTTGHKVEDNTEQSTPTAEEIEREKTVNGDEAKAEVAAQVADTAQNLDDSAE